MFRSHEVLLAELADGVLEMDETRVATAAREVIDAGLDAYDTINSGLVPGMSRAGDLFETEEYFVPELLLCSDAMYAGIEILRPHIRRDADKEKYRVVIGVVEGDTHDVGKNLVKIMLDASGFEIHDLGRNVPLSRFVEATQQHRPHLLCLSTLMTTTMTGMQTIIQKLKEAGIRDSVKVLVGGGPISLGFARNIGADGYADNAAGAVKLSRQLVSELVPA